MGRRINAHGDGTWNFPGGHLEFGESLEECAVREVEEETGIKISNIKKGPYTNDLFLDVNRHYITIYMIADWLSSEPKILEPNKCEEWSWFEWDSLPEPLFLPIENLLMQKFSPI